MINNNDYYLCNFMYLKIQFQDRKLQMILVILKTMKKNYII